jgi:hypothetical protein
MIKIDQFFAVKVKNVCVWGKYMKSILKGETLYKIVKMYIQYTVNVINGSFEVVVVVCYVAT